MASHRLSQPNQGEYNPNFEKSDPALRQGDVINFLQDMHLSPHDPQQWSSHLGVIVTADCDLAHRKHAGTLSYIPAVPTHIYSALIAFPRMAERIRNSTVKKLRASLPSTAGWPTFERILEMTLQGKSSEHIARFLPDHSEKAKLNQYVSILEHHERWRLSYDAGKTWEELLAATKDLLAGRALANGANAKKVDPEKLLRVEMGNLLHSNPPGDVMFLTSPAHHFVGFMAYLRLIREIPLTQIALSAYQEFTEPNLIARRVGRLRTRYLHRLTQKMAAVFTDIGLPDEYDESRELILSNFINNPKETSPS